MNQKGIILLQIIILIALIEIGLITTQLLLQNYKTNLQNKTDSLNTYLQEKSKMG